MTSTNKTDMSWSDFSAAMTAFNTASIAGSMRRAEERERDREIYELNEQLEQIYERNRELHQKHDELMSGDERREEYNHFLHFGETLEAIHQYEELWVDFSKDDKDKENNEAAINKIGVEEYQKLLQEHQKYLSIENAKSDQQWQTLKRFPTEELFKESRHSQLPGKLTILRNEKRLAVVPLAEMPTSVPFGEDPLLVHHTLYRVLEQQIAGGFTHYGTIWAELYEKYNMNIDEIVATN